MPLSVTLILVFTPSMSPFMSPLTICWRHCFVLAITFLKSVIIMQVEEVITTSTHHAIYQVYPPTVPTFQYLSFATSIKTN